MPSSLQGNKVILPATSYSSSWSTSVDGSGVKIGKNMTIPAPGGRSAEAKIASKLTGKAVLTVGARAAATIAPWVAGASILYDVYEAYRVRPDGSGGLAQDPGTPPELVEQKRWTNGSGCQGSSPEAVLSCIKAAVIQALPTGHIVVGISQEACHLTGTDSATCGVSVQHCLPNVNGVCDGWPTNGGGQWSVFTEVANVQRCPAVVDFNNPANSLGVGQGSVGADGKCPTGAYSGQNPVPLTAEEAANVAAASERSGEVYKQIMDEILDRQPVPIPKGAQTQVEAVTPSKVDGPVTTTTSEEGVQQDAVGWDWGRISQDIADNFQAGEWKEKKTSTLTRPDGSTKVTTTTQDGTTAQEEAAEKGQDPCILNPERVGCLLLGTAPTDQVPKVTRDLTYSPITLSGASGCPSPVALPDGRQISYQPLCDGLTKARPVILIISALIAAGIVAAALRA